MQPTLNSFPFMSDHFFIKQSISIFFMPYVSPSSAAIKEYIFDFNPTNSLIIFP